MAVPTSNQIMSRILEFSLSDERPIRQYVDDIAQQFKLTQEQCEELVPGGTETRLAKRVRWTIFSLHKADLLRRTGHGVYIATELGRDTFAKLGDGITLQALKQFPAYQKWESGVASLGGGKGSLSAKIQEDKPELDSSMEVEPPDLRMRELYREHNAALADDLLVSVRESTPQFMEQLIVRLIGTIYGNPNIGQHLGKRGDEGVDGLINQDTMGLDRIYLQVKRYKETPVGPDQIDQFAGALGKQKATKGVFVTASRFTSKAREAAEKSDKNIRLIDGEELALLLIDYNVGVVQEGDPLYIKKVDENYFPK